MSTTVSLDSVPAADVLSELSVGTGYVVDAAALEVEVEVTAEVAAVGVVSASCEQAVRLTPTAMAATAANDLVRFVVMTRS